MVARIGRINAPRMFLLGVFCFLLTLTASISILSLFINTELYISYIMPPLPSDETPPIIQLKGPSNKTIAIGSTYIDEGIVAYDDRSDVTVDTNGTVDSATVGEYTIKYTAYDEVGNSSSIERHIKVVQPTGIIYLTFDDGPGIYTARLLDILKRYGIQASFFVTGFGEDDLIRREYDEGHTVALHSFSHDYSYVYSSVENYYADLDTIKERVKRITGSDPILIRFPGGSSNTVSRRYDGRSHIMSYLTSDVENHGYTYFDWNVNSGDADGASSSDEVYENVVNSLKVGGESVVLQHDVKEFSVNAVERIIQYGLENGYIFSKLNKDSFTAHHGVNN